jgi:hypothetical protein
MKPIAKVKAEAMTMIVTRWIFVRSLKIRPIP